MYYFPAKSGSRGAMMGVTLLPVGEVLTEVGRFARAKRAFTTRRVDPSAMMTVLDKGVVPCAGDLVLARVDKVGHHKHLELTDGRRAKLFPGDEIIVSYGNRYAPDQFEAKVGADLSPCSLIAGGGVAATVVSKHWRIAAATAITPVGLIGDRDGKPVNLKNFALRSPTTSRSVPSIVVLGTAMNAGKTTTAAWLINGLTAAGHRVGAIKLTGTGSGGDTWHMRDAGAAEVLDFTDAGHASTYLLPREELAAICRTLTAQLAADGCSAIVAEVADGLYQREVAEIVRWPPFRSLFQTSVFAAQDAVGAAGGVVLAQNLGLRVAAISGVLCQSKLLVDEAAAATGVPCHAPRELGDPEVALGILLGTDAEETAL